MKPTDAGRSLKAQQHATRLGIRLLALALQPARFGRHV